MQSTVATLRPPATAAIARPASAKSSVGSIRANARKHTNPNPLQRWLIARFHWQIARVLEEYRSDALGPLLDLGCGEGYAARALRTHGMAGIVIGVDADFPALEEAARTAGLHAICASAAQLPLRDDALPDAICLEVLEHLQQPEEAIRELSRVAGHLLVFSVPHQPFFSIANLLRGKNWRTLGDDPDHRHAWRPAAFVALVRRAAEIVDVRYSFPWLIVVARSRAS